MAVARDDHRSALQLMHEESPEGGAGPAPPGAPPGAPAAKVVRSPARRVASAGRGAGRAVAGGGVGKE